MSKITCPECNGTGAYKPDCWLCEGDQIIPVEKAISEGYSEKHLEGIEDDGNCRCPAEECNGDSCDLCDGMGTITPEQREDEVTRVLMYGLTHAIPPRLIPSGYGRVWEDDQFLFSFAGGECRERGWIRWYCSVLGDEVSLTPAGEAEAKSRAWAWARRRDVTLGPVDDLGRFVDDGGMAGAA